MSPTCHQGVQTTSAQEKTSCTHVHTKALSSFVSQDSPSTFPCVVAYQCNFGWLSLGSPGKSKSCPSVGYADHTCSDWETLQPRWPKIWTTWRHIQMMRNGWESLTLSLVEWIWGLPVSLIRNSKGGLMISCDEWCTKHQQTYTRLYSAQHVTRHAHNFRCLHTSCKSITLANPMCQSLHPNCNMLELICVKWVCFPHTMHLLCLTFKASPLLKWSYRITSAGTQSRSQLNS